jgi:hypothetical protein
MKRQKATFEDAAKFIAPSAPAWLTEFLRFWGAQIAQDFGLAPQLPTKKALHRRLLEAAGAADIVADFLDDQMAMVFLEAESESEIRNIVRLQIELRTLSTAARTAAASSAILTSEGKVKRGRGKARADKFISPKEFCALIIKEAWSHARGRLPAPNSQEAAAAARALWLACGGATGWGSDPRTGWADSFKEVASDAYRSMRTELRQHLTELSGKPQ